MKGHKTLIFVVYGVRLAQNLENLVFFFVFLKLYYLQRVPPALHQVKVISLSDIGMGLVQFHGVYTLLCCTQFGLEHSHFTGAPWNS